jgi:poly-gamma-glutamate capsule biosynthesis protein CapA/YwtB (metallophosphatase superfamily)
LHTNSLKQIGFLITTTALVTSCGFVSTNQGEAKTQEPSITAVSSPTASPTPELRTISIVSSGDILLHERLWAQAQRDGVDGKWDFYPQLADFEPVISSADLALCHLETPLAELGVDYQGYPVFNSPPQITAAITKLGFDMCSTASNHSLDQGFSGLKRTIETLNAAGIPHTGTAISEADASAPLVIDVQTENGIVKVGILSYTYGFNGFQRDSDKLWSANLIDPATVIAEASLARSQGAEIVVAKMHWGSEYANKPNDFQESVAKELADSGLIDLIDGSHSHSVQPLTQIGNTVIAYGHGNFVAAQREPTTIKSEGLVTRWEFVEDAFGKFSLTCVDALPTFIRDNLPVRVIDVNKALSTGEYLGETKQRLEKAKSRTDKTVRSLGFSKFCD